MRPGETVSTSPDRCALILAAARLADGTPAAAVRVAGLTVLERSLFVAREAGARRAIVVAEAPALGPLRAAVVRPDVGIPAEFESPESEGLDRWLQAADDFILLRADVVLPIFYVRRRLQLGRYSLRKARLSATMRS
ncbi:MAG: hypothetical protein HY906_25670 [Deltaproteobacteria bacterium]|nr:hypothetical protein [Deltaproteobacteria bacterium]